MKDNRFQQVLAAGGVPVGHMILEFATRGIAQIVEAAGVDFVVIDMEHTGLAMADVANLVAWFKATTVAPFVRIPQIEYHFVARALDVGALGIMAPNVRNAIQAQLLVAATKYAPLGQRGVMLGSSHTDFRMANPREFFDASNRGTTLICQIESQEGLDNLEAIATTPGIDVLWPGQFDLSQSMGIPGEFTHPRFLAALNQVVTVARQHGLAAAIQPLTIAQAQEWRAIGFNAISFSGDFFVYQAALSQAVNELRRLL